MLVFFGYINAATFATRPHDNAHTLLRTPLENVGWELSGTPLRNVLPPLFVAKSQGRRACEVCVGLTPVSGVVACYRPSQHTGVPEISLAN